MYIYTEVPCAQADPIMSEAGRFSQGKEAQAQKGMNGEVLRPPSKQLDLQTEGAVLIKQSSVLPPRSPERQKGLSKCTGKLFWGPSWQSAETMTMGKQGEKDIKK